MRKVILAGLAGLAVAIALIVSTSRSTGERLSSVVPEDVSGEQIPILGWFGIPTGKSAAAHYRVMKEAGFTHNLPGDYVIDPALVLADLDNAQTAGIQTFVVGDAVIKNAADAGFISRLTAHPALAGYKVWDEPATADFDRLSRQVADIQAIDNRHPCYINLLNSTSAFAGYETMQPADYSAPDIVDIYRATYLRKFAGILPFISFDQYPVTIEDGVRVLQDSAWYRSLEVISGEARTLGKPLWAFALAVAHSASPSIFPVPTLADLRLQVYSNLAYGAQCIQYFTYWTPSEENGDFHDGPIDWYTGAKNPVYDTVQTMNREIIALSKVFLRAKALWTAHAGRLPHPLCTPLEQEKLPEVIRSLDMAGSDGAIVSLLEKGADRFLVIVNRDLHRSMTVAVKGSSALNRIRKDGSVVTAGNLSHSLAPGDALIYFWKN